ncbi:MAG TPA: CrcB family protein [Patescibacteria group bacterium]|nr:CrcB family protein [Patescibacteria group bacterium]
MTTTFLVALGGSAGAVSRFVLDGHIRARFGQNFPWATIIINVSGSFLLGVISGVLLRHHGLATISAILGAGFCGGYTTFSTASFETVRLMEEYRLTAAIFNTFGTLFLTLSSAGLGIALAHLL